MAKREHVRHGPRICGHCWHVWRMHGPDGCDAQEQDANGRWLRSTCGCPARRPDREEAKSPASVDVQLTPGRISFATPDGSPLTAAHLAQAQRELARIRADLTRPRDPKGDDQ